MKLVSENAIAVVTIYQEARGEKTQQSRIGVAEVIRNRTKNKVFSDGTVVSTCLWAYQFSGWNPKDANRVKSLKIDDSDPVVADCMLAWQSAQDGSEITNGADHYLNLDAPSATPWPPDWYDPTKVVAKIGAHTFLRLR